MATEVKLPDEAKDVESVTVSRWLVKAGDAVKKGQPILEVATEKVDTEIESPVEGTVLQINFSEGELIPPDAALALIGEPGEVAQGVPARAPEAPAGGETEVKEAGFKPAGREAPPTSEQPAEGTQAPEGEQGAEGEQAAQGEPKATPVARRVAQEEGIPLAQVTGTGTGGQVTKDDVLAFAQERKDGKPVANAPEGNAPGGQPSGKAAEGLHEGEEDVASLMVRRAAAEHNVDLRELAGDRPLGSLSVYDVLTFAATRDAGQRVTISAPPRPAAPAPAAPAAPQPSRAPQPAAPAQPAAGGQLAGARQLQPGEEFVPHSRMRTLIARNTVQAAFTIPQVTTWWDVNMLAVLEHRKAHKEEFARAGVRLTVTPYLVAAVVHGLRAVPAANATWADDGLILKKYYNIGVAAAIPPDKNGLGGLIVPVVKNAENLSLMGVARTVNDLAERARTNALKSEDLSGGTFTISNYGTSGSRFQTPIIMGNQAGILGVGVIEKRPVVVSHGNPLEANSGDYMAFLPMLTLGFSYDHRILDGATADAFCHEVKDALENWPQQ
jgi:pyruvate/2-oxoglutarate dehydrogenase complex dihydrolipoamide acyltransferase (E2) component